MQLARLERGTFRSASTIVSLTATNGEGYGTHGFGPRVNAEKLPRGEPREPLDKSGPRVRATLRSGAGYGTPGQLMCPSFRKKSNTGKAS
jgi:hypothetical protein